jgi:hypothetical protein
MPPPLLLELLKNIIRAADNIGNHEKSDHDQT